MGHQHDLFDLRASLVRLRHVHIHLIAVKIGVVGTGHGELKAEGGERHHPAPLPHHRHFMERGRPIEDHHVAGL